MARRADAPLTIEKITKESRFLLRTLLREDLFGSVVSLSEAEKLLEPSLSLGFVDYCAFLKKGGFLSIDRVDNTVGVTERGRLITEGLEDAHFHSSLASHFSSRLKGGPASAAPISRSSSSRGMHEETTRLAADPGDLVSGRYVRYDAIGQGSLGTVYRGKNVVLGHSIALKEVRHVFEYVSYIPRDEILKRLRREVMAQAALVHPHILAIHDVEFDTEFPFLIMDYAQGGSLKDRIFRAKTDGSGILPVDIVLRYLLQISYGLVYAHSEGVVHGNLKPENVLFDRMGNIRLADFGVARVTEKAADQPAPVYVGMGAPSYMAPEQLHSTDEVGKPSDVYALGILLYEMLTGQLPGRRSPMPSEINPEASTALDDLFDHMTHDQIDRRLQNLDQVLEHLYKAFPAETVLGRGSLLLFETDPIPPPCLDDDKDDEITGCSDGASDASRENAEPDDSHDDKSGTSAES